MSRVGSGGSIVIPPSWLGDAVLSLPAIEALGRLGPVALLAHPRVHPLFALVNGHERLEAFAGSALSTRALRQAAALRALRPERVIVFPRSFSSALRAATLGAPRRIGIAGGARAALLTDRVRLPWRARSRHIAEEFGAVAVAAGAAPPADVPRVSLGEDLIAAGRFALRERGAPPDAPLVALCPGAAFGPAKRWFAERFAEVARRAAQSGAVPLLLGGPADRDVSSEVARQTGGARLVDLTGATSIAVLAALLSLSRVAVVNDSGPMHLAAAVGTPVVALFGSTNPDWTAPRGEGHALIRHPVACSPCYRRTCPIGLLCFAGISVDAVWSAVRVRL